MKLLIAGGTGFIGRYLIAALLDEGCQITVVSRDIKKIWHHFSGKVESVSWHGLIDLDPNDFDAIINLAGENIGNKRWSISVKHRIKESRVKATNAIFQWCNKLTKPLTVYNASAIGIYGLTNSSTAIKPFSEKTTIAWNHPTDFLSEVGQAWEQTHSNHNNPFMQVVFLRFAPVLHRKEGVLGKMLPLFRCGIGGPIGNGRQPFSWIHINDAVRAIQFLLKHPDISGPINIAAPDWVSQRQFAKTLGKILHRPAILAMPAWLLKLVFGQMAEELLLSGQAAYPDKLLEYQFEFLYPTLEAAIKAEIGK